MTNPRPAISIVTPSFNQGSFIAEAIESVTHQRSSNYTIEHWVMDGDSNDHTIDILRNASAIPAYQHVKWNSEPDGGQSAALNKGFRLATGEIIGWLNTDDRYRPGAFETVVEAFARHPDIDVLYGDYTLMDEAGSVLKIRREIEFNRFILNYHRVLYIPTTSTFFRRRVFAENNWLNEDLHYAMDADFFMRLATAGYRFQHIPALLADFRLHPASKSCAQTKQMMQERRQVIQAHSLITQRWRSPTVRRLAFAGMRTAAAAMRYSEKLLRGYYANHQAGHHDLLNIEAGHVNS